MIDDEIFKTSRVDAAANETARQLTIGRFGKAPKVKINRDEFQDLLKSVYLLAQTNAIKDVRKALKEYEGDEKVDVVIGITDIAIVNSHNALVTKTKYGRRSFNLMDVEDLIYDRSFKRLCKKPGTMKVI